MKRVALGLHALVLSLVLAPPAIASSITGDVAIGGTDTYSATGVNFHNPGFVFMANGSLAIMATDPTVTMNNIANFATAGGELLFNWTNGTTDITLTILNLTVQHNGPTFLNVLGTGTITETGFSPTHYDISLTSTRTDSVTDYAFTASAIPEPGSLLLVGSGLVGFAGLLLRKVRKPAQHC